MADLEKYAIKRDKRFIVRLVLLLAITALAGLFIYGKMVSSDFADCAAGSFGAATEAEGPSGASEAAPPSE